MRIPVKELDQPLYQCFVQPELCQQLNVLGLTDKVPYLWKVFATDTVLYTKEFDVDDYYTSSVKHVECICPPQKVIPAYTIKDIEKCLPSDGYSLQRNRGTYYLYTTNYFQRFRAERMPDAYAACLQQYILDGRIRLRDINMLIAKVAI
jgi:hypothetical protein